MAARYEITDAVFRNTGAAIVALPGASATVKDLQGNNLTVYQAETGSTTVSNPLTTDSNGQIEGFVEAPDFDIAVTGTGITSYTQKVRVTREYANVKSYGAKGDDTTNDTAAIQAAINAVPSGSSYKGGDVVFPPGIYKCSSSLSAITTKGVRLLGPAGSTNSFGGNAAQGATIKWTGTGSGRFIDARSSYGFELRNLGVEYTSGSFTGTLIDFAHDGGGNADAAYALIENCNIGGQGAVTAAKLISFDNAILCRVVGGRIGGAVHGIRFAEQGSYSNAHQIEGVTFDHCTTAAMANFAQGIGIKDCWFEGTGTSPMPRAYKEDRTGTIVTLGLSWEGGWFGDGGPTSPDAWIDFGNAIVKGFHMSGVFLSGGTGPAIKFSKGGGGVYIHGYFENAIDLGDVGTGAGTFDGVQLAGHMPHPLNVDDHRGVIVQYHGPDGDNNQSFDRFHIKGHLAFLRPKGTNPTIVAEAGAGTGRTATVDTAGLSSDGAGTITLNTGTGTTTGLQATLTFASPYESINSTNIRPKLFLMPRNDNTAAKAAAVSSQATGLTTVAIYANPALTASTTYIWDYLVVQ